MKNIKLLFIVLAVLTLSACATSSRQALTNSNKAGIRSNRIVLNSTQREIVMQHNNWFNSDLPDPYAPMDSGTIVHHNAAYTPPNLMSQLIIAGVQHHQANNAINAMATVRNVLEDFNFLNHFNAELKYTVAKLPWLKVQKQDLYYNLDDTEANIVAVSKENTTLFIGTTYALNSVFRQLEVAAYVKLVQKPVGNQKPRTLYANNFYFVNRLSEPNTDANKNEQRWIKNNGNMLKTKLRDAASLLSSMITMDISNPTVQPYAGTKLVKLRNINGVKLKGKLIKEQNGYYIIVLNNNEVYAVNADNIVNS